MAVINSFRELRVYQELKRLHLAIHDLSLTFPRHELYELGSQMRRSSNAAPAILAEGWGSQHTNIYLEAINRAKGELRETQHHLDIALAKHYLTETQHETCNSAYEACDRMLTSLYTRLSAWRGSTRETKEIHDHSAPYIATASPDPWPAIVTLTTECDAALPPTPP